MNEDKINDGLHCLITLLFLTEGITKQVVRKFLLVYTRCVIDITAYNDAKQGSIIDITFKKLKINTN